MARPLVHIVASCTDRKRQPIPPELRLGALRVAQRGDLFTAWWRALERHAAEPVPAVNLYGGDHWTVIRDLPRAAGEGGLTARLWVASAGYGLVPAEAPLRAYGATFTPNHPDSVVVRGEGSEAARRWWQSLTRTPGPLANEARSVTELARRSPGTKLLIVASPRYVGAMEEDLREAASVLRSSDDLLIVSGQPGPTQDALRGSWIPSMASLVIALGGTRVSLHARVARHLLAEAAEHGLGASSSRLRLAELARSAPPLPSYDRTPLTDEDVRRFVAGELRKDPGATHTRLLRSLRDGGRACEQARFKQIFQQVKER